MVQTNQLQLEVLFLLYTLSDQHGKVDMTRAHHAAKRGFQLEIPLEPQLYLKQHHLNALVAGGFVTNVLPELNRIFNKPMAKKVRKPTHRQKRPSLGSPETEV